jgi:putative ABC transport system permease protein
MFKNYIKIAWRNALRNQSHSLISLISLLVGFTFFFLITLWVKSELSVDRGFKTPERICRVETSLKLKDGTSSVLPTVGWPVGKALTAEYPEIESLTYLKTWAPVVNFKGNKFYETAFYGDNNFFNVFGYELTEGNTVNALSDPHSLVISSALKEKYFGKSGDVVGKTLLLSDGIPYKITGVFKDQATLSHLQFDMIGSFSSLISSDPASFNYEFTSGWYDVNVYNYVKLKSGVAVSSLSAKVKNLILNDAKGAVAASGMKSILSLRPVSEIYLYSGMPTGTTATGNIKMVQLFILIGFFILIIACLNFINLTTAKSMERAKEIGIKKVLGSARISLIFQFLTESALMCLVAASISTFIIVFSLPAFNHFTGKLFTITGFFSPENLVLFVVIILVIIPLAGFYPALVLSSHKPIKVLKGNFAHTTSGNLLRKGLVITQFAISITFILSTIVIWKQMNYMQKQDLGFDKDKIILVNTEKVPWDLRNTNAAVYKTALRGFSGITNVTACNAVPGRTGWGSQFAYPEGKTRDQGLIVEYIPVDHDYVKTIGLKISAGRDFIPGSKSDEQNNFIINESAAKSFGWNNAADAIGKKLSTSGKNGVIIGVLKDYHQHALQEAIKPVVLGETNYVNLFAIRYNGVNPAQALKVARDTWDQTFSGYPFDFKFMDDDFQTQYKKEESFRNLFELAAFLSIAIACLGLLGLAIYTAQKRVKEIGIRKVLGASVASITTMLSREFIQLILISILLASPVAWYAMNSWLQQFAYKTHIDWWLFPLAGSIAIGIALLTIGFNSVKAALSNPANSLRSE